MRILDPNYCIQLYADSGESQFRMKSAVSTEPSTQTNAVKEKLPHVSITVLPVRGICSSPGT